MESRVGEIVVLYSARGIPSFTVEVFHDGLHKHAFLRAPDESVLRNKANMQVLLWDKTWSKQLEVQRRIHNTHESKEAKRLRVGSQKETAAEKTLEAEAALNSLKGLLVNGIELDPALDWERLKDKKPFPMPVPVKPKKPSIPSRPKDLPEPVPDDMPREPRIADYPVKFSIIDRVIGSRKKKKVDEANSRFQSEMRNWRKDCEALADKHATSLASWLEARRSAAEQYGETVRAIKCTDAEQLRQYEVSVEQWNAERTEYEKGQTRQHESIDDLKCRYQEKIPAAVIEYFERVLSFSEYPSFIPREFDFDLFSETRMLILNCRLPAPDDLPLLSEVKYIQSTDELRETILSETQRTKLYDDVIYQIALRTVHELFQSDYAGAISAIVMNGIVSATDRSTGNESTSCILSIQASRDSFLAINLAKVDPKACFRQLKGVGSSKMHSVTPIAPILELQRDDRRFVPSYAVAERLTEGYNLATMDWEDFEHLVREIFGKEFSSGGGEVKVTQASRDGGVDAVAFDPDPIRGGKIVIQAKRYMHTVGVSAVRDLYGTVMNEGASKGILVTTSDYGPDAYSFANGKPLTLLSGANLMHLLSKHGVKAHINLAEARKVTNEIRHQAETGK